MSSDAWPIVLIPQPGGGYFVACPVLPSCYSQGDTEVECLGNIREAIELSVEDEAELRASRGGLA